MNKDKLKILKTLIGTNPLDHYNSVNNKNRLKDEVNYWYEVLKDDTNTVSETIEAGKPQLLNEHVYNEHEW